VVDPVEELGPVHVHHPLVSRFDVASGVPDGILCPFSRAKSVARSREALVEDGVENLLQGLLDQAIEHRRDRQRRMHSHPTRIGNG
jgi:hypothetical protein